MKSRERERETVPTNYDILVADDKRASLLRYLLIFDQ
jgi:hypothetical protein